MAMESETVRRRELIAAAREQLPAHESTSSIIPTSGESMGSSFRNVDEGRLPTIVRAQNT